MCIFLCLCALYHLYKGWFYVANPEFLAAYTMIAVTLRLKESV